MHRSARIFLTASLLAPLSLLAACGTGRSEGLVDDAGPPPSNCPAAIPLIACFGCGGWAGPQLALECVDGNWECPTVSCPDAGPEDAAADGGTDACASPVGYSCPSGSECGVFLPVCSAGVWNCEWTGSSCDASFDAPIIVPDAPYDAPPDAPPPPPPSGFSCGDTVCDSATSYCLIETGGPLADGGAFSSFLCQPLPFGCSSASPCECLTGLPPCGCVENDGEAIVTCPPNVVGDD